MARPGACRSRLSAATVLLLLTCPSIARAAAPEADSVLTPLLQQKSVLIRTKDDRWLSGKPVGAFRDTLVLKHGNRKSSWLTHVRTGEIENVWAPHSAPAQKALVLGIGGFVGGALLEIGLGSDCPECAIDAGEVLKSAATEGVVDAAFGAFLGLFGGGYRQLVPAVAEGDGVEPYPGWAATVAAGAVDNTGDRALSSDARVFTGVTTWFTGSPGSGWGMEFGTLTGIEGTSRGPVGFIPNGNTGEFRYRSRWGYGTFLHRWRARRGTVRPGLTFGLGSYIGRNTFSSTTWDSLGVLVSHRTGESTDSWFGLNLGTGVSFGRGAVDPGVEVRAHWAISPATLWYTLALKADWH